VIPIEPLGLPIVEMPTVCCLKVIPKAKLTVFQCHPVRTSKAVRLRGRLLFEHIVVVAMLIRVTAFDRAQTSWVLNSFSYLRQRWYRN